MEQFYEAVDETEKAICIYNELLDKHDKTIVTEALGYAHADRQFIVVEHIINSIETRELFDEILSNFVQFRRIEKDVAIAIVTHKHFNPTRFLHNCMCTWFELLRYNEYGYGAHACIATGFPLDYTNASGKYVSELDHIQSLPIYRIEQGETITEIVASPSKTRKQLRMANELFKRQDASRVFILIQMLLFDYFCCYPK